MIARAKSGIFKPEAYAATIISEEPESFDQAIKDRNWKATIDDKHNSLIKNRTWNLVLPPEHKNIVGCR